MNALASDLAGRYGDGWYGGSKYAIEIYEKVEKLARKIFNTKHAFITPISGNICDLAIIFSFTRAGDEIVSIPKEHGGYPLSFKKFERRFYPLPMKDYVIDEEKIEERKVPLVLIASSIILFPHPLRRIAKKFDSVIAYDASHVLGLIAGGQFQQPLKEGANIMIGSPHKSFPGPQGGIVLTNDDEIAEKLAPYLLFDYEQGIGLIDNPHLNRIACLGIVMEGMNGKHHAKQIVRNAKLNEGRKVRKLIIKFFNLRANKRISLFLREIGFEIACIDTHVLNLLYYTDVVKFRKIANTIFQSIKNYEILEKILDLIAYKLGIKLNELSLIMFLYDSKYNIDYVMKNFPI